MEEKPNKYNNNNNNNNYNNNKNINIYSNNNNSNSNINIDMEDENNNFKEYYLLQDILNTNYSKDKFPLQPNLESLKIISFISVKFIQLLIDTSKYSLSRVIINKEKQEEEEEEEKEIIEIIEIIEIKIIERKQLIEIIQERIINKIKIFIERIQVNKDKDKEQIYKQIKVNTKVFKEQQQQEQLVQIYEQVIEIMKEMMQYLITLPSIIIISFSMKMTHPTINGLSMYKNFLTEEDYKYYWEILMNEKVINNINQEEKLVNIYEQIKWNRETLGEKTIHYGARYEHTLKSIINDNTVEKIPEWLIPLINSIEIANDYKNKINQITIIRYDKRKSISLYLDNANLFDPNICILSLGANIDSVLFSPMALNIIKFPFIQVLSSNTLTILRTTSQINYNLFPTVKMTITEGTRICIIFRTVIQK